LMCRHCKQIWCNWEYRLFLTGMHDGEKKAFVIPGLATGQANRRIVIAGVASIP